MCPALSGARLVTGERPGGRSEKLMSQQTVASPRAAYVHLLEPAAETLSEKTKQKEDSSQIRQQLGGVFFFSEE